MTNTDHLLSTKVAGFEVRDFYEMFGARFNLPRPIARKILKKLEEDGSIEVVWRCPRGARFFVRRGAK